MKKLEKFCCEPSTMYFRYSRPASLSTHDMWKSSTSHPTQPNGSGSML